MMITIIILGLLTQDASAEDAPSCGFLSLCSLHRLEGTSSTPASLNSKLPPEGKLGYSMEELRRASSSCGLPLKGVILHPGPAFLDRPAIVFFRREGHGHFITIRPVGKTTEVVQVLDSFDDPRLVYARDLFDSPTWTGLALIPERPNKMARVAGGIAITSGLALVALLVRRRPGTLAALETKNA
jgi:hypothetical protein